MSGHVHPEAQAGEGWVAALRRFAHAESRLQCELCGSGVSQMRHRHFLELASRRLICACEGCALTLGTQRQLPLRLIPQRIIRLGDAQLNAGQWEAMPVPVGVAFFVRNSGDGRIAVNYPGPAGATESTLDLGGPEALESRLPSLAGLQPDVEALLMNRMDRARECYIVPIDRCYALVGLMRSHWRGFTGGPELRTAVADFFAELGSLARVGGNTAAGAQADAAASAGAGAAAPGMLPVTAAAP